MRAGLLAAVGAGLSVALFPSAAVGATAFVEFDAGIGGRILWYQADPGEANQVEVTHVDPNTTIRDLGAVITAGPGCVSISANEVSCADINYFVSADLGDGDDEATVVEDSAASAFGVNVGGGDGNDELSACDACGSTLGGGAGDDILTGGLVGGGSVFGGGGNDIITGNPRSGGSTLSGGTGHDTITGGGRRNTIQGGGGNDAIMAGPGSDLIEPGGGADNVDGGPGSDTVSFRTLSTPVLVDLRIDQATADGDVDTLVSIANGMGTRHSDRLIGDGEDNRLDGAGGDGDEVIGGGGDDLLHAGDPRVARHSTSSDDRLLGGAGDDVLKAGSGGDLLVGGSGRDTLQGHGGDDRIRAHDGTRDVVRGGVHLMADRASVDDGLDDVRGIEIFFEAART